MRMTFKLPKVLLDFVQRLRRKSQPNFWQFGFAVREVIGARLWRAMTGELSAAEARRMIMEKQLAAVLAHLAYVKSISNGKPASALGAYFDVYQRAVESNRKRLRNRLPRTTSRFGDPPLSGLRRFYRWLHREIKR
jgi:hypothetical protein